MPFDNYLYNPYCGIPNCGLIVDPNLWKIARVLPLPKVKNPNDFKDLRPISILPTLSKAFEKILVSQLKIYLNKFNILPENQSGFRALHSCSTALLTVTDDIIAEIEKGNLTLLVLINYTKAFDQINHRLLIAILNYIGFSEGSLKLLMSYLNGRFQYVSYNSSKSKPLLLENGVPQGSILGPILFALYIMFFIRCLAYSKSHFYADDTQLYLSFGESDVVSAIEKLNEVLDQLQLLSEKYCLSLNPGKSQVMLFGPRQARERVKNIEVQILD